MNLNKRIRIESPSPTQDSIGEMVPGWAHFATVWANVSDLSGREYLAAGGVQNAAQTKITIRYLANVLPEMRILHDGITYQIDAVLGADHVWLLLMCRRLT